MFQKESLEFHSNRVVHRSGRSDLLWSSMVMISVQGRLPSCFVIPWVESSGLTFPRHILGIGAFTSVWFQVFLICVKCIWMT